MNPKYIVPGMRIETTGEGQTRRYPRWRGTVTRVFNSGEFSYVDLDGEGIVNPVVLKPNEFRQERHGPCPCAICRGR